MSKFELSDIEAIKDYIREAYLAIILLEIDEGIDCTYKIYKKNIEEAEHLIALMDSLKEENL